MQEPLRPLVPRPASAQFIHESNVTEQIRRRHGPCRDDPRIRFRRGPLQREQRRSRTASKTHHWIKPA
jgi:hypothetical protein